MIIDFNEIQEVANPQFKGGEGNTMFRTYNDGQNKIMRGRLEPGCSIGYHSHETNSEIIYILSGEARCLYDDGEEHLAPGQCHRGSYFFRRSTGIDVKITYRAQIDSSFGVQF